MTTTENWDDLYWDKIPYLCFDTETTGFSKQSRICEIAIVIAQGGKPIEHYHQVIDPQCEIDDSASQVHGLYDDDVKGMPTFAEARADFIHFFYRDMPWVAHNLAFDARMMSYNWPAEDWPRGIPTMCTMQYSKSKHPSAKRQKRHRLADVANYFGVDYDPSQLHDALYDTSILSQIVPSMLGRRAVGPTMNRYSHEWIK